MAKKINKIRGSVKLRGSKWHYSFDGAKIGGKRNVISGVCIDATCEQEAIKFLNEKVTEYDNGGSIKKDNNISVSDYLDRWYEKHVLINTRPLTQQAYLSIINKHIKPGIGAFYLKNITTVQIQDYINLKSKKYSKSTVNTILRILKSMFKYAKAKDRVIQDNPAADVELPKNIKKTERQNKIESGTVSTDEMNQILAYFNKKPYLFTTFVLGYYFGTRVGETTGLTWDDFDFDKMKLDINRQIYRQGKVHVVADPKTGTSMARMIFGKDLKAFLDKVAISQTKNRLKYGEHYKYYKEVDGVITECSKDEETLRFVIRKEDGSYLNKDKISYAVKNARADLGFYFRFHMLRHTHGTMITEQGADPFMVKSRLRHGNVTMSQVYVEQRDASNEKMGAILDFCLQKINL